MNKRSVLIPGLAVLGLTVTLSLASCSSNPSSASPAPVSSVSATESSPSSSSLIGDWGVLGVDAEPVTNTDELMQYSDVMVTGVLASLEQGEYSVSDGNVRPVIARLDEVGVHAGELAAGSDGSVYVALVAPAGVQAVTESLPLGTPFALYGWQINAPGQEIGPVTILSGMPADQPLYGSVHPAGIALQLGTSSEPVLVWPDLAGVGVGQRTDDILPGADLKIGFDDETS